MARPHAWSVCVNSAAFSGATSERYGSVTYFTAPSCDRSDDLDMNVLVTISVLRDEGEEIGESSASAETPEEAFALALGELDIDEDD